MCHFLTIAVPGKTVPEVPKEFRRTIHFAKHANRSLAAHTPADWTSFLATSGGCSCDFYRAPVPAPDDPSRQEEKYRKKGWSEEKIRRALGSRKEPPAREAGLREDILDLVTALAIEVGEIRLSLHWYSGDIETERFSLIDVGRVSLGDFRRDSTLLRDESTLVIEDDEDVPPPP